MRALGRAATRAAFFCLLAVLPISARAAGWEFPAVAAYTAGAADNGLDLGADNAPGASITVTLPNPGAVGNGWAMGFGTGQGRGVILDAPVGAYILAGQKTLTSLTLPSETNYEFASLTSDGANFRLVSATAQTALTNGLEGAAGGQSWTYLFSSGYSATAADNGHTLYSGTAGAPTTITLPSTSLIPTGWAITAYQDSNPLTIQVNAVSGGQIETISGDGVSSWTLPGAPRASALIQFDGANFRINTENPPSRVVATEPTVWAGNRAASNAGIYVAGAWSGTASLLGQSPLYAVGYAAPLNLISVNSDSVAASDSGLGGATTTVDALTVNHLFGGSSALGSRTAIDANLELTAATGNSGQSPYNAFYNGIISTVRADANDGGTSGTQIGDLYGVSTQVSLAAGATWFAGIHGGEWDISVASTASVTNKTGLEIALTGADGAQGSNLDNAILISRKSATSPGWKLGIAFGTPLGQGYWPFAATGTLIGTYNGVGTVANGIDFSGVTFTGCSLKLPASVMSTPFCVNQQGFITTPGVTSWQANGLFTVNAANWGTDFAAEGPGGVIANFVEVIASPSGSGPTITVAGSDTNAALNIQAKGLGNIQFNSGLQWPGAPTNSGGSHLCILNDGTLYKGTSSGC